jgi:hypothetical protein
MHSCILGVCDSYVANLHELYFGAPALNFQIDAELTSSIRIRGCDQNRPAVSHTTPPRLAQPASRRPPPPSHLAGRRHHRSSPAVAGSTPTPFPRSTPCRRRHAEPPSVSHAVPIAACSSPAAATTAYRRTSPDPCRYPSPRSTTLQTRRPDRSSAPLSAPRARPRDGPQDADAPPP